MYNYFDNARAFKLEMQLKLTYFNSLLFINKNNSSIFVLTPRSLRTTLTCKSSAQFTLYLFDIDQNSGVPSLQKKKRLAIYGVSDTIYFFIYD